MRSGCWTCGSALLAPIGYGMREDERGLALEHVPKKLLDFFDSGMLQLFDFERFLVDQMNPSNRETL